MPENVEVVPQEIENLENNSKEEKNIDEIDKIVEKENKKDTPEQEEEIPIKADEEPLPTYDIRNFKLSRILSNNTVRKTIALLGKFPNLSETDEAIIIFEKKAFRESEVQTENGTEDKPNGYFTDDLEVQTEFINNIYGSYQCIPKADLNNIKATVVYPATEKHIQKYTICQKYLINETPSHYANITLPYIESSQFSLEWVYNILEHKQETERIVFEDPDPINGFILLPDLKWDGRNLETLYLLAIPHKHNIKSLRDLTLEHLPLLKNIEKKAAEAIEGRYGLSGSQLRMYFHYQPSFYHLHVHINPVKNDAPGIWCDKSHMLTTVINNLELLPEYYQKATLPFVAYEGHKLLDLYDNEMQVRKTLKRKSENDANEESEVPVKMQKCSENNCEEKAVE